MKKIYFNLCVACTFAIILACKRNTSSEWSDSDIESLQGEVKFDSRPPLKVIASTRQIERDMGLKIFDAWAKKILTTQKSNPKSPLNQLKKIFNPDHLKPLDFESAFSAVKQEGSGQHGSLVHQRKPQDYLYHALWSRIADAAGLLTYPRAGKHMKHFLGNSGKPIRYAAEDSSKILKSVELESQAHPEPVGVQIETELLKDAMKKSGYEIADSEATMIASMNRKEKAFFVSRLQIRISLADFIRSKKLTNAEDLIDQLQVLKNKKLLPKNYQAIDSWNHQRPLGKTHRLISSQPQSDSYFALGTFSATHFALPLEAQNDGQLIKILFSQWETIYDRYNWDEGKFVTLLSGWCWNLQSDYCFNIEELISFQVSDKSLARLHKLGIAHEFEIFGQTRAHTVWESTNINDLNHPRKPDYWKALIKVVQNSTNDLIADE